MVDEHDAWVESLGQLEITVFVKLAVSHPHCDQPSSYQKTLGKKKDKNKNGAKTKLIVTSGPVNTIT